MPLIARYNNRGTSIYLSQPPSTHCKMTKILPAVCTAKLSQADAGKLSDPKASNLLPPPAPADTELQSAGIIKANPATRRRRQARAGTESWAVTGPPRSLFAYGRGPAWAALQALQVLVSGRLGLIAEGRLGLNSGVPLEARHGSLPRAVLGHPSH